MQSKQVLIKKLFNNQCSRSELKHLLELLHQEEVNTTPEIMHELILQLREVPPLKQDVSQRILHSVIKQTQGEETTPSIKPIPLRPKHHVQVLGKVAAFILLFVALGFLIFRSSASKELVVQTNYGELIEFALPDGSVVTLNGKSKISYPSDWAEGDIRSVKLQGEAYFHVKKKPTTNTKFQVITKDLTIEVLGTAFNVNTRQEVTKVFLEEGKVKLKLGDTKTSQLLLSPGEVMSYSASKKLLLSPKKVKQELLLSWKDGVLTFRDTSLKEILEKLAATNNFEVEIENAELANRAYTLSLPNDNMESAMNLLSKTTGTSIIKQENKYIIREKKTN